MFVLCRVPNHNVFVGASYNQLLSQTGVHAVDWLIVERTVHILAQRRLHIGTVEGKRHLKKLMLPVDVEQQIISAVQDHLSDGVSLDLKKRRLVTLRRADRLLLRSVELALVPSCLVRPDHTAFASKDETAVVRPTDVNSHVVWLSAQETRRIWHRKQELSFHAAHNNFAFGRTHDELDRILAPLVASELCREVSRRCTSSFNAIV